MSNFSVGFSAHGDVQVLTLQGELDAHTASELEAAIQKCKDENKYQIVINGADLQYISSAGLGVLMAYIEDIRDEGGDIKLAALQPKVFNVFDLLGFPMLFDMVETEEKAFALFEQREVKEKEPARSQESILTLDTSLEEVEPELLDKFTKSLRDLTKDENLRIKDTKKGSIRLELDIAEEAKKLLQRLFADGSVRDLAGFRILSIDDVHAEDVIPSKTKEVTDVTLEESGDRETTPKVFISHAHVDETLVGALVTVLETALVIEPGEIRCTSLSGYKLPIGDKPSTTIREDIEHTKVVLGVVTPDSVKSDYVLFELGASWGREKPTFPLLAGGATEKDLPGPLAELHCIHLSDIPSCFTLILQLVKRAHVEERPHVADRVAEAIMKLATIAEPTA